MSLTSLFTDIANAIRAKDATTDNIAAATFPERIRGIQTGIDTSDATVTAGDILSGKTAYAKGAKLTGTIASRTASNLTASGATVTVPAGFYASQAAKSVATAEQATPSISVDSSGKITASATQAAGYVSSGTKSATQQLTTQAAQTITPGTEDLTIAAGKYLTGAQTVKGDVNLSAENIKSGVSIFDVEGTYEEDPWTTPATLTIRFLKSVGSPKQLTIKYYDLAEMRYITKYLSPRTGETNLVQTSAVLQTAIGSLIAITYQYSVDDSSGVKSIEATSLVGSSTSKYYLINKSEASLRYTW